MESKGKEEMVWGTFRLEERDGKGERIRKSIPLGLRKEFATESEIQKKLDVVMDQWLKPGAVKPAAKTLKFGELAEEWKAAEGPAIKR
jgi:hypothetical protein